MDFEISKHTLAVTKTARYFLHGEPGPHIRNLVILIHGYGMLAEKFISYFKPLAEPDTLLVAPEGLSRFYLDAKFDKVGASWMTKEDRMLEIHDQIRYLDKVYLELAEAIGHHPRLITFGFSQGCATLYRWLLHGKAQAEDAIFWAGSLPEEDPDTMRHRLQNTKLYYRYALKDEYVPVVKAQEQIAYLRKISDQVHAVGFDDKHVVNQQALVHLKGTLGI